MTGADDPGASRLAQGKILVVDDQAVNRELLTDILEWSGYTVIDADGGAQALARVAADQPDLVLLDVNMPELDGLEVCQRLRADPATAALPIILVTSLAHRENRLEGIAAGANDYLTKPIDRTDLLLRVRNALHMRRLHREAAEQFERLQRLEHYRDNLVHMIVHDLRSPLTGIRGFIDLIRLDLSPDAPPSLRSDLEEIARGVGQMTEMVSTLLDVSRLEAEAMPIHPSAVDLGVLVTEAVGSLTVAPARIAMRFDLPDAPVTVQADPDLLRRVVANLVANAVKFTPTGGQVSVAVSGSNGDAKVQVSDTGAGIPPEHHARIFEKFAQAGAPAEVKARSSGLGLTFCKLAIEAHNGHIGVESGVGRGSTFWITLPLLQLQ